MKKIFFKLIYLCIVSSPTLVFTTTGSACEELTESAACREEETKGLLLSLGYSSQSIAPITDKLFLSSAKAARDPRLLETLHISHVLNLTGFIHGSQEELRFPPQEGDLDFQQRLNYRQLTVEDSNLISYEEFLSGLIHPSTDFLSMAISENPEARVIVHCEAGISRSSSMVIAYLMCSQKIPLKLAYEWTLAKKANIGPNNRFFEHLIKYEKELAQDDVRILDKHFASHSSLTLNEYLAAQIKENYFKSCDISIIQIQEALGKNNNDPHLTVNELMTSLFD